MTAAGHVNGQMVFFEGPFVNRFSSKVPGTTAVPSSPLLSFPGRIKDSPRSCSVISGSRGARQSYPLLFLPAARSTL